MATRTKATTAPKAKQAPAVTPKAQLPRGYQHTAKLALGPKPCNTKAPHNIAKWAMVQDAIAAGQTVGEFMLAMHGKEHEELKPTGGKFDVAFLTYAVKNGWLVLEA